MENIQNNQSEWEFNEIPEKVDFQRIENELRGISVIELQSYLSAFGKNAPKTYELYLNWRKENNKYDGCLNYESFKKDYWTWTEDKRCIFHKNNPNTRYCR